MKTVIVICALLAVAAARPKARVLAPLLAQDSPTAIEGKYLVEFKEEIGDDDVATHKTLVKSLMENVTNADYKITHEYHIGKSFRGYAAAMNERLVDEVRAMEGVKHVERDQVVTIDQACELQSGATWGLVRTTLREEWNENPNDPLNEYSHRKEEGAGVHVYIIDTGVDWTHSLFEGRATENADFVDDPPPSNGDPNGHGTHVAGTVMANIYGLARSATVTGVRVLNSGGGGSWATILAGVDYVANQKNNPAKKIVSNMSLGGGASQTTNDAVNACVEKGVHMSVSAGNDNFESCRKSPASAEGPITTAASDTTDTKASFSNYGDCVDIIAPGVNVISTTPNEGTASFSGTSMAAPHVAGVVAKVLSLTDEFDDDPQGMKAYLKSIATKDKITGFPTSPPTDNDLLFLDCQA